MEGIIEFRKELEGAVMEAAPDDVREGLVLKETEVVKINDQKLLGLTFVKDCNSASPTFWMNPFYEMRLQGLPVSAIAMKMVRAYEDSVSEIQPELEEKLKPAGMKDMLDRSTFRVVDMGRNREYLKTVPYMEVGYGLAAIFDVQTVLETGDVYRMTVTRGIMESEGLSEEVLFENAMLNADFVDPAVMLSLEVDRKGRQKIKNHFANVNPIRPEKKQGLYMLSNKSGKYGTAALFYPGIQERIAEKLGEGYFAVPGSIHEFLIIPDSAGTDINVLHDKVRTMNEAAEQKDVLSDSVLHYDIKSKRLTSIDEVFFCTGAAEM